MKLAVGPASRITRVHAGLNHAQALPRSSAVVGVACQRCLHVRYAAASDEKSKSQPMFLSDLIAFETDIDSDSSTGASTSSSTTSTHAGSTGSSSDLASTLGLAGSSSSEPDATQRAQDIINRATEVLAAARAALGTDSSSDTAAAAASTPSGSSSKLSGSSSTPVQQKPVPSPSSSSSGNVGISSATSPTGGPRNGSGTSGSEDSGTPSSGTSVTPGTSSASSTEQLTRRWSQLSDGQDLTRHVLQNALDQMQSSGAPIAAPKDTPSSSSSRGGGGSSNGAGGTGSSSSRGPNTSSRPGSRMDRDIRFGGSSSSSLSGGRGGSSSTTAAAAATGHGPAPTWAQSLLGADDFGGSSSYGPGSLFPDQPFTPKLQPTAPLASATSAVLAFADDAPAVTLPPVALGLISQSALDAQKAKTAVLPPLQSVIELTTAFKPPERSGSVVAPAAPAVDVAAAAAAPVGKELADGSGRLADGTWWEKKSGVEYGKNGYWKRWQLLKGGNADGTLHWEETWWEASDYTGLKEMGAEKTGRNTDGAAWRESWSERMMYASNDLDCVVERNAHKWAAEGNGDEWEEKWGEHYHASGKVAKYADKWGKQGPNVWHERWGEDYDSGGDACVKWTDKWAERLLPGGAREQWGDKWHEAFANGRGEKNGEVWSVSASGDRYQRWWGEQHLGDRRVRRHGHSTTGELWDDTIEMDTYYNPVPHFGFKLALQHSPQLRNVPLKPKPVNEKDPFGPGIDAL